MYKVNISEDNLSTQLINITKNLGRCARSKISEITNELVKNLNTVALVQHIDPRGGQA